MSGKAQVLILIGTALIAMLVGAASYTLYRFWPRQQPAPKMANFKPEDMETYKAASAAVRAFTAHPACEGEDAKTAVAKLAELKEDAKVMAPLAGMTELTPEDYLKLHITLAFDFAAQAQDHGCVDLAENELRDLTASYADDTEVETRAAAALAALQQKRASGSP
jgi:hypothetical protein